VPENQNKHKTRERGAIRLVAAADAHGPYSGGLPPKVPPKAPNERNNTGTTKGPSPCLASENKSKTRERRGAEV
jgi:hypothetical protein